MRKVRVLSVAQNDPVDVDDRVETNLSNSLRLLDEAANYDPDFVCFPELVLQLRARNDGNSYEELAQPIPGPATDAVGEKARELDSYVLYPLEERDDDAFYNSVAFIDPDGDVVGTYRKLVPTIREVESGTRPGDEVTVWDTPFGRVGVLVCFDSRYDEIGVRLAQKDADLVFFPTTGSVDRRFRSWAVHYGFHVAYCDKNEAKMYTPTGDVVAENDGTEWGSPAIDLGDGGQANLSFAEVNTDCMTFGHSQSRHAMPDILAEYGGSVVRHPLPDDGTVVLESIDEDVAVADIADEYGLEPMFAYEDRTRQNARAAGSAFPFVPGPESGR